MVASGQYSLPRNQTEHPGITRLSPSALPSVCLRIRGQQSKWTALLQANLQVPGRDSRSTKAKEGCSCFRVHLGWETRQAEAEGQVQASSGTRGVGASPGERMEHTGWGSAGLSSPSTPANGVSRGSGVTAGRVHPQVKESADPCWASSCENQEPAGSFPSHLLRRPECSSAGSEPGFPK